MSRQSSALSAPSVMRFAGVLTISFGLLTAAGAHPALDFGLVWMIDFLDFPLDGDVAPTKETRFLAAIL